MDSYIPAYLRDQNRFVVLDLFIRLRTLSRAEISKITNISKPTVTKIIDYFLEKGIIEETGNTSASTNIPGRKGQLLRLNADKFSVIGIYFEGNYLDMGLINLTYDILDQRYFPFQGEVLDETQYAHVTKNMLDAIALFQHSHPETTILGIGIGIPGIVNDAQKTIAGRNIRSYTDFYKLFSAFQIISGLPVYMENDINAASLGEILLRKDEEMKNLLYLSLGTGFGSGIIIDGQIWHGNNYFAGDIGSILYRTENVKFSGDIKDMRLENKINIDMVQQLFHVDIGNSAECSSDVKRQISDYISGYLTPVIYNLNYILDIPNFVLAGLLVDYVSPYIFEDIREKMKFLDKTDSMHLGKNIMPSISNNSGIIGASAIALEHCLPTLVN